ncbi:MAG: M28 family peptidase [Dehalococcoidia bacterium]
MNVSPEVCSEIIRQYDSQGWHRTATAVDDASGRWLCEQLAAAGTEGREVPFAFKRLDLDESFVKVPGVTIPAVPLIDSCLPGSGAVIRAKFGEPGEAGTVAIVELGAHGMASELESLRSGKNEAIVACIEGPEGGQSLLNAWHYDAPKGPPIVQVPGNAREELQTAKASGLAVEIHCGATRTATEACNIRADVRGSESGLTPLIVLTPRSGWWHCAGERGGGLAIWLELVRLVKSARFQRDVIFLANTGHELGFLGAKRYFESEPLLAAAAKVTVHLGANIGAAGAPLMVRSSDEALLEAARSAGSLARFGTSPQFAISENPAGEAGVVHAHGGKFISLIGPGFEMFHSTLDRWPEAINPAAIAAAGDAVFEMLLALDREP